MMNEKDIYNTVDTAFKKLEALSGIEVLETESSADAKEPFAANVRVLINSLETEYELFAEFRSEIREKSNTHMRLLMTYFNHSDRNGIVLVSNYIHPKMKEYLRKEGLNYLEASGNCWIRLRGLFLFVDGQKNQSNRIKIENKSFNQTGLKMILTLLLKPDLLNSSYREIAKESNVSLGSVGAILQDLENQGYVVKKSNGKSLSKKDELFERWNELYPLAFQSKNLVGTYRIDNPILQFNKKVDWTLSAVKEEETYDDLKEYTLYTTLPTSQLKSQLGLVKDKKGGIEVMRPFWKAESKIYTKDRRVNLLLNYSDFKIHSTRGGKLSLSKLYELKNKIKPILDA